MSGQAARPEIIDIVEHYPKEFALRIITELGHMAGRNLYHGRDLDDLAAAVAARAEAARGHDDEAVWAAYAQLYRTWAEA